MTRLNRSLVAAGLSIYVLASWSSPAGSQDALGKLGAKQDYRSRRISSYDRSGGNADAVRIEPGATLVLAQIKGPAAIHHIWTTIDAEAFYGRKLVIRAYWDGEESPSIEAPIGDFFGVGHGLDRNVSSLPIACSSEGRARNAYWYMPFRWACRLTVTNDGSQPVDAFYFYIDYRELPDLDPEAPYFHAQYRQETPCEAGRNYVLLDASGRGHYVGCNLSVLQRTMGWWGEGDDMIYVDGEETPSLHGTGSEDYFSDAWGMREGANLFYGCPLQEQDFNVGAKASVYRFHIPDPLPFRKSIKVTIEHGHANTSSDFYSSVAYWYQTEPHNPYPPIPAVDKRLPFAMETMANFALPRWQDTRETSQSFFEDKAAGLTFTAPRLVHTLTSYYSQDGTRFPVLSTDRAAPGTRADLGFTVRAGETYDLDLYFVRGPAMGNIRILQPIRKDGNEAVFKEVGSFEGYAEHRQMGMASLKNVLLGEGSNTLTLEVTGRDTKAAGADLSFMGIALAASARRFISEWNVIGPFDAPDMESLMTIYPPEKGAAPAAGIKGKDGVDIAWKTVHSESSGYVRLTQFIQPVEQVVAYGQAYVLSPDDRRVRLLVGSDDGVRVWVNEDLVHSNPVYRGAYPDMDSLSVHLKQGWNRILIKVLQGSGGWGFYLRFADPMNELKYALSPGAPKSNASRLVRAYQPAHTLRATSS
jgi:hypothetical protein